KYSPKDVYSEACLSYHELIPHLSYHEIALSYRLIELSLSHSPIERPTATAILKLPYFWDTESTLEFFGNVSEKLNTAEGTLLERIEENPMDIFNGSWTSQICDPVMGALSQDGKWTYDGQSVKQLLRAMRNMKSHYRQLKGEALAALLYPDSFFHYFTSRFPELLRYTYEAMEWCSMDPIFKHRYSDEVRIRVKTMHDEIEIAKRDQRLPSTPTQQENQNDHNPNHKTRMCTRPLKDNGKCRMGDRCTFAHNIVEQREAKRKIKKWYKTTLCKDFTPLGGVCPRTPDEACDYIHPNDPEYADWKESERRLEEERRLREEKEKV
ncbi:hypothetical protein PENTCL1PPCAC_1261, partial [Pristionchus entomophagus]